MTKSDSIAELAGALAKPTICQAIPLITGEVDAITKKRKNASQNYNFRGIDDAYAALNPLLAKHGVSILPEILDSKHEQFPSKQGGVMWRHWLRVRYHLVDSFGVTLNADSEGEAMDSGDKATGKALSVAYKSMVFQVFAIPTEEKKDIEDDSPEVAPTEKAPAATPEQRSVAAKPSPAAAPQNASGGTAAVSEAKAFEVTAAEIAAATTVGDLAIIESRLPKVGVTDGMRRILAKQIKNKLAELEA